MKKSTFSTKKADREAMEQQLALESAKTKRKMLGMLGLLLALVFAFAYSQLTSKKSQETAEGAVMGSIPSRQDGAESGEGSIVLPNLDVAAIASSVNDATRDQRVILEREPLDTLLDYARILTDAHYAKLEAAPLDAGSVAALVAAPAEHRGQAYRMRGYVDSLRSFKRAPERPEEHRGRLTLEDGSHAYFTVLQIPEGLLESDFVRIDGLFLKVFSDEGESGYIDAPFLVGTRAVRSYPALDPDLFDGVDLRSRLTHLEDDSVFEGRVEGVPFQEKWEALAYAQLHAGEIDWAAAPELGELEIGALLEDGRAFRGKPFRIPISKNMDAWTNKAPENPARLPEVTEGWIGNWAWSGKAGLVHYFAPQAAEDLRGSNLVKGQGFFVKNFVYEGRDGQPVIAPFFVLSKIEPHIPPVDNSIQQLFVYIAFLTVGMIGLFAWLLRRESKKSADLQQELVRRRRARREADSRA